MTHFSTRQTPQAEPIPGSGQVPNSAGGYAYPVDDWVRLDRFLILGSEGGSYYASERKLTVENAQAVLRCLAEDGPRVIRRIVEISESGRAPKNDPAIFALAMVAGHKPAVEGWAEALPRVCRTGTHLFQFAEAVQGFRGWGRSLRRAVSGWYTGKDPKQLAYQLVKYQQRSGWSHRDLLRLAHPRPPDVLAGAFYWAAKGWPDIGEHLHPDERLQIIWAFEYAKRTQSPTRIVELIREFDLPRECIPTQHLNDARVWDALLEKMPLMAMTRNLGKMSAVGLLKPMSVASNLVAQRLTDSDYLRRSRIHPVGILAALLTYGSGHGVKGSLSWQPVVQILDALDRAFYLSFANVEPTGKRWLLALDVSGSMESGMVAGVPGLTPRVASAALALVTAATEPAHQIMGFSHQLVPVPISPRQRLDDACRVMAQMPMGGTDCSLPMLYALENHLGVDVCVVLTDSETWAGNIHPAQALRRYREHMGIPAKLIVCGMVSNGFSIACPADAGMLDVVGFDTATPAMMADFVRDSTLASAA